MIWVICLRKRKGVHVMRTSVVGRAAFNLNAYIDVPKDWIAFDLSSYEFNS